MTLRQLARIEAAIVIVFVFFFFLCDQQRQREEAPYIGVAGEADNAAEVRPRIVGMSDHPRFGCSSDFSSTFIILCVLPVLLVGYLSKVPVALVIVSQVHSQRQ
jgi:hypothetical protein